MSVNGITNNLVAAGLYDGETKTNKKTTVSEQSAVNEDTTGVVYEPSDESATKTASAKTYKSNPELIAKLQADAEERVAQFKSLVEQLLTKQGKALGEADSIWRFLASGDFTVDAETQAQAQKDIAEDGYWGVEQTSERILDFAEALTGGDPEKMEEMRAAFQTGFENATAAWGKELPELSQKTYEAVMAKFDKFAADAASDTAADAAEA